VFLSAFLPEGQESTRASSPALSGPCSRRRQHAQPGALHGVRVPLDRVFPSRCGYPHRGQAHRRSEIGTILPLAPLSPVSRGKIEETDSGKTDYRNRLRTGVYSRGRLHNGASLRPPYAGFLAAYGVLTAHRVRDITASSSWRPASSSHGHREHAHARLHPSRAV